MRTSGSLDSSYQSLLHSTQRSALHQERKNSSWNQAVLNPLPQEFLLLCIMETQKKIPQNTETGLWIWTAPTMWHVVSDYACWSRSPNSEVRQERARFYSKGPGKGAWPRDSPETHDVAGEKKDELGQSHQTLLGVRTRKEKREGDGGKSTTGQK